VHEGGKHVVAVPSVDQGVVSHGLHLGLGLEDIDHRRKPLHGTLPSVDGLEFPGLDLLGLESGHALANVLGETVPGPAESPVFLLLLPALELFIRIAHEDEVLQGTENRVPPEGAAHVDQAVLEASPVLPDHDQGAVLQGVGSPLPCRRHGIGHAGEHHAAGDLAAHFNGFLHGDHADFVARIDDVQISLGDVAVFLHHRKGLFLVYGQHSPAVAGLRTEDHLLHKKLSYFQFHRLTLPEWNNVFLHWSV